MDIGVRGNSRQAFALARKRYSSDSQLYSVRWGSEPVPNDAVQSGRPPRIYEDTHVHMPNTEVKLTNAESTWLEAAWEDRKLPNKKRHLKRCLFYLGNLVESQAR